MSKSKAPDPAKYRGNPKEIAKYLNAALSTGDAVTITIAIGDMVRAQGVSRVSRRTGLRREGLYKSFRGHVSPLFGSVIDVLLALDLQLVAKPVDTLKNSD